MQSYRCFFLNRHSHIERAEIIEAMGDAEAVARAEAIFAATGAECGGIEVWDQARRVHARIASSLRAASSLSGASPRSKSDAGG